MARLPGSVAGGGAVERPRVGDARQDAVAERDHLGVAEAVVDGGAAAPNVVAPFGQAGVPRRGRRGPRPRPGRVRRPPTCRTRRARRRAARRPSTQRPARTARPGDWSWRSRRARSWTRIWGCESPPIVPSTARSEPSGRVTRAGDSVCGGRRPGAHIAGCPSPSVKPMPRSWRKTPVAGSTMCAPHPEAFDWMRVTPMRSRSTAHADRGAAGPQGGGDLGAAVGVDAGSLLVEPAGVEQLGRVGGVVEDGVAVAPGDPGGLDEEVGPRRVVGVVGQVQPVGHRGARPGSGSPGTAGASCGRCGPRRRPPRGRPTRPGCGRGRRG